MAGKFTPEVLDDIKSRASIREVVAVAVPLKRKGNDWWGCCPFHHEKSPSFHVKEDKGFYHCFGCGAHGNVFDFVKETRGGGFVDAVEYLAEMTGVKLQTEEVDPALEKYRNDGFKALERAQVFYQRNLDRESRNYLEGRGLSQDTIKEFGLGWAADEWSGLRNTLSDEKFSPKILQDSGLTLSSDKSKSDYDRFRGRVMFPIQDLKGRVISFGGRILGQGEPKYLNGPETAFFNKRYQLYNLNRARDFIRTKRQALIVEGYMDVVSLWQQGVKTAVAPMGTAITEDQVKLLWRHHDAPVVCMDGDTAGRKAATRIAEKVLAVITPGKTLKFAYIPEGEDPDSFIQKKGKASFDDLIARASTLEDVLWGSLIEGHDIKSGDGRAAVEVRMKELMKTIVDETIRSSYWKSLKDRLWHSSSKPRFVQKEQKPLNKRQEKARILLSILFRRPELMEGVSEKLSEVQFENEQDKEFQSILFRLFEGEGVAKEDLDAYLENIDTLARVKKSYKSHLVEMKTDAQLETYWWESFADVMKDHSRRSNVNVAADVFISDEAEEVWNQLKEIHKSRFKKRPSA